MKYQARDLMKAIRNACVRRLLASGQPIKEISTDRRASVIRVRRCNLSRFQDAQAK